MSPAFPMRILYLPQLRGGHGVLNKNWNRQGCCTEGPREGLVGGQRFSAPEAGGAHGRALLVAQGVSPASLPPVPPTGSRMHCPPSPLLGEWGQGTVKVLGLPPSRPGSMFQVGPLYLCWAACLGPQGPSAASLLPPGPCQTGHPAGLPSPHQPAGEKEEAGDWSV